MRFSRPSICVTVLEEHYLGIGVNRRDCEELYLNASDLIEEEIK
ncbi:hypothetical protein B4073_2599 [Bacillus subtilis]|nr:hypothetical protein B4069_2625 [Bacillus subtilis]KIN31589.1 hypothetical protein B4068_2634 [Bacillus subtilis]KIN43026.1 hypothetical protein B4072_2675 [Bacillus subtilis]KIN43417.1 hypothetical protein B4071_2671 [Bacillus subtilis]KIN47289.1 hypothetical protein B4073_2599 [Bacillus subtilis]